MMWYYPFVKSSPMLIFEENFNCTKEEYVFYMISKHRNDTIPIYTTHTFGIQQLEHEFRTQK